MPHCRHKCLARANSLYAINIKFMFNGNRLAFVKSYKLQASDGQVETV